MQPEARPIPAGELGQADEVFLSSTAGGIIPVTTVDGEAVGNGGPGPVTRQLRDAYWDLHDEPRFSLPVHYD
jgi:branched-chain amino acid aminotransferase